MLIVGHMISTEQSNELSNDNQRSDDEDVSSEVYNISLPTLPGVL